jgi:hypothetical protein
MFDVMSDSNVPRLARLLPSLLLVVASAPGCDRAGTISGLDCTTDIDADTDSDSDADADTDSDTEPVGPWVEIVSPADGASAPNPVELAFEAGGGVATVEFFADDVYPLQDAPILADQGTLTYEFSTVNVSRDVTLIGYDGDGVEVAEDSVSFVPFWAECAIPDQDGFNRYTVAAINDWLRFPKDGTYPYCWEYYGDVCGDTWGQIYDGIYGGETLFGGGGDCFCSGHTLEMFLDAWRRYREENGLGDGALFQVDASALTVDSVDVGEFYQWWQGFGVADTASAAEAFESQGIGENIYEADWDTALPGDFVNLSRSTGSGHSVIFVGWITDGATKIGLRYYGCNGSGDSCADESSAHNVAGVSGPSFNTELFEGYGGTVQPAYLFIGRVYEPTI